MNAEEVLAELRAAADPTRLAGMARVGIATDHAIGVSVPHIRRIAKRAGRDTRLAQAVWDSAIHEARMVAGLIADPDQMSLARMRAWAREVDSWDLGDLLADTFAAGPHADRVIGRFAVARHGFTKRLAFAMIARLAVSDHARPDAAFLAWFPLIRAGAADERNEVKKGVSWALRQIGKRNPALYRAAIAQAEELVREAHATGSPAMRWVGRDVLREMALPEHVARLGGAVTTGRARQPRSP
jgi:3-methyladenine DNA glycosylase AlkD